MPRLILLDDAFPKIDVRTHPLLFGLLVDLDLDFVLTSERLWGDHPNVPSLAIYEALRAPGSAASRSTAPGTGTRSSAKDDAARLAGPTVRCSRYGDGCVPRWSAGCVRRASPALDRATRHALSGVLGRPLVGDVPLVLTEMSAAEGPAWVDARAGGRRGAPALSVPISTGLRSGVPLAAFDFEHINMR